MAERAPGDGRSALPLDTTASSSEGSAAARSAAAPPQPAVRRGGGRRLWPWRDLPLQVKLTLTVTVLVVAAVLAVTLLSIEREQRAFRGELEEQAEMLLDSLSVSAGDALYYLNLEHLSTLAMRLAAVSNVDFVHFFDSEGRLLADGERPKAIPYSEDPLVRRLVGVDGTLFDWTLERLAAGRTVTVAGQRFGSITIGLSTGPLKAKVTALRTQGLLVSLLAVLGGAVLVLLISRPSMKRLAEMVRATRLIADGDFEVSVPVRSRDELGVLAGAFNHMSRRLTRTLEELRETEERYALATRGANDGLWDWDLRTNRFYCSPRWQSMLGFDEGEIGSSPDDWLARIHVDDRKQVDRELSAHLGGRSDQFRSEHRIRHRDGSYRWVLCRGLAVRDADGAPYRMAGSQTDITERKRAEHQLIHDALHDALTALPNRTLLLDRLSQALEHLRRGDMLFAVLFIDLDRFKLVNDSLGHPIGDQLLVAFVERVQQCLRASDTLARLGGDEFVVLLEFIEDAETAVQVAERVLESLSEPFEVEGHRLFTRASIGIVINPHGYDRAEEILRDADVALYRAKALGRARYVIFDSSMRERTVAILEMETALRQALKRRELELHYQPIVDLDSDRICGFEALVRWAHPEQGLLLPEQFLHVAEEIGVDGAIDAWVLERACRQLREWEVEGLLSPDISVSVNLSSRRLLQASLVDDLKLLLSRTRLSPSRLRLEVTEGTLIENTELVAHVLDQLRDCGVEVQIDDFGTGYSSLSYLCQFTIGAIKIDRSFVSRLESDGSACDLVRTIVRLASDLDLRAIAEGVETSRQLALLLGLGCRYGQGFLFSPALTADAVAELLRTSEREKRREGVLRFDAQRRR